MLLFIGKQVPLYVYQLLLPLVLCTANRTHQCYAGDDPSCERASHCSVGLGNDHCQHRHQLQRKLCHPAEDICITVLILNLELAAGSQVMEGRHRK